jgi:hypothetical protein
MRKNGKTSVRKIKIAVEIRTRSVRYRSDFLKADINLNLKSGAREVWRRPIIKDVIEGKTEEVGR